MRYRTLLLVVALTAFLGVVREAWPQTSSTNSIAVEHPWARATPVGAKTGAAYVTIVNHGSTPDRLIHASTPLADKVQFHQENNDNGVMRMREVPAVPIGSGALVTLKPGGTHIMIVGLRQQLKDGQTLPLTLDFEKAGKMEVKVPIAKAGAMEDHDMGSMHIQ